jgi:hypothetical protein
LDNTITDYRACFGSGAGRRVLGHLLIEAGYFDTDLQTEGEIAVQNFAKKILRNLGLFEIELDDEGKPKQVKGIDGYINGLFGVDHG